MRKTTMKVAVLLVLTVIWLSGCKRAPKEAHRTEFLMDTTITITAYGSQSEQAVEAAFAEMRRLADLMNANDSNSEVALINKNAGLKPVRVSPETFKLLEMSLEYSELSNGAFDVTVRPLVELWGIGKKDKYVPSEDEIQQVLKLVDYRKIILDPQKRTVFLSVPGMGIDLGGVAKGYAADQAKEVLKKYGVSSALIGAGGNIWAMGVRPDGQKWRIGIRHPRPETGNQLMAVLPCQDVTVVTSGDYERYFVRDGMRYHHIFDPRTGRPANKLISATVVGTNSAEADILSTALFVLGAEQGQTLIGKLEHAGAVLMTPESQVFKAGSHLSELELVYEEGKTSDARR